MFKNIQNKKEIIVIISLFILFILSLIKMVIDHNLNKKLHQDNLKYEQEIVQTYFDMDSIKSELQQKIETIDKLGGKIDTLLTIKKELQAEMRSLKNRTNKQIKNLKSKVDGYRELLVAKDEEIKQLQITNALLFKENIQLKVEKNKLSDSLQGINNSKNELEKKIAIASKLKAENITVIYIDKNGKEKTDALKERKISALKIQFDIPENKVSPIDGKDILLKIINPEKNTIFDISKGSGTFLLEGKEAYFSAKQNILYDNTLQKMTFLYEKNNEYMKGKYTVEIYTDGYLMGKNYFIIQ
ncbi:MAG: hypothetical protein QM536_01105 [Chitinophagaceae bacterium]|nr:hypothetical protein [Chitinophagaceae bacterium]